MRLDHLLSKEQLARASCCTGVHVGSGPYAGVRSAVELTGGTLTSSVHDGFLVSSTTFPGFCSGVPVGSGVIASLFGVGGGGWKGRGGCWWIVGTLLGPERTGIGEWPVRVASRCLFLSPGRPAVKPPQLLLG